MRTPLYSCHCWETSSLMEYKHPNIWKDGEYGELTEDIQKNLAMGEQFRIKCLQLMQEISKGSRSRGSFVESSNANKTLCSSRRKIFNCKRQWNNVSIPEEEVIDWETDYDLPEFIRGESNKPKGHRDCEDDIVMNNIAGQVSTVSKDPQTSMTLTIETEESGTDFYGTNSHSQTELSDFPLCSNGKELEHNLLKNGMLEQVSLEEKYLYDNCVPYVGKKQRSIRSVSLAEKYLCENYMSFAVKKQRTIRRRQKYNNLGKLVEPKQICESQSNFASRRRHETYSKDTVEKDGLEDLWREMAVAIECSKSADDAGNSSFICEVAQECQHSLTLKDDLGYVCQLCGLIKQSIEKIFDYSWRKGAGRIYVPKNENSRGFDEIESTQILEHNILEYDSMTKICIHPRHREQMKPHQLEGFKFLEGNLLSQSPRGCILAHAPGSGKTFLIVSFIQSYLAKYPNARPLVVVPKGIVQTWKSEFQKWELEKIDLFDFYSSKANSRSEQLDVLNKWVDIKSVLFLGYKQFSNIICQRSSNQTEKECRNRLLTVPSIMILDEGHIPRNEATNVLQSLEQVQTYCKVVLSGTLFQNRVKEVFNLFNLVRPNFMKSKFTHAIVRRILSKVESPYLRMGKKCPHSFFFTVVETILRDNDNFKLQSSVVQDLRELTGDILHYYRGDLLENLHGIVDFTVILNLCPKQRNEMQKLEKLDKFKRVSVESALYVHPSLKEISENCSKTSSTGQKIDKIDQILGKVNVKDGVKTKFFLSLARLTELNGERMLVFSQYLLPLKFLQKLLVREMGWRQDKEIFMITGDSNPVEREQAMEQLNNSSKAKVLFASIKACGEGISLVGASRVVILDVVLNPAVTRQAIGRAFRPGQLKRVYVYRLVAADSLEEKVYNSAYEKELVSKNWFDWSEFGRDKLFKMETVDAQNSEDPFMDSSMLREDIKMLLKRYVAFLDSKRLFNGTVYLLDLIQKSLFVQVTLALQLK
ncbi:hypothetical protein H6P81_004679 [Aristolochia fimbriata]|uniref:Uncharacterized protein n=1 Tax=Aristolochia fimbriata TaxID=158543 RepID=A0AAV7ESC7_ARIFI|nr:hypothetical protein H6P81_004679 [Aristolochia fimbriata]